MRTTLEMYQTRLALAELIDDDLRGRRRNGLTCHVIGDYTVVDDGQDIWVGETEDLDRTLDEIVEEVMCGEYDRIAADPEECVSSAYDTVCCNCTLYSKYGGRNDLQTLLDLDEDDHDRQDICELLSVWDEVQELMRIIGN